jgi:uncharacterized damage-inducible protein DinB
MPASSSFSLDPTPTSLSAARAFIRHSRFRLRDDYRVKIAAAVDALSDEQVWWRPNEASNSIGNLILHLCGNARQWILAGVAGQPDTRRRADEFSRRDPMARDHLLRLLETTIADVDRQLAALDAEVTSEGSDAPLQRVCVPQGFAQNVLDAVYHVVEHFSYHTGQVVMLAKWHVGAQLRLYDDAQLNRGSE